ncbi:GNAT family N-acetyltransferase [Rhodobacter calidifons]|uniref:GNAT family N-acetyltransferase n=1 Tax=Rhodobacter calidifons TaxID=2715277 RepID=A0ABX0G4M1_9RHOB|nr:GNAT family N-acetyltransferase [Rhodobacter calidifons]NHB76026.1 GNAT family N-acetyltransferase [Rhodobacter calidifons]
MTPETIPEHLLTNADESEIAQLLARCFATDFGGRSFFQTRHTCRHVLRHDQRIIAHLALQLRAVRLGEALVTIAGIADVATDPDHRGRGHATRLLQAALAAARRSPARHVLLFGTAKLYAAAGFRLVENPLTYLDMTGARTGQLHRDRPVEHLQCLDLGPETWDGTGPLDLLGGLF